MEPRLRLDISWRDLAAAVVACFRGCDGKLIDGPRVLTCFSVRSAFDLALSALALGKGDEVVLSSFTVPHMEEIVKAHGATPVALDLDPETMAPSARDLEAVMTRNTRLVVVAHLFGARLDLTALARTAHARGALLVEDAAQAYDGQWRGHKEADLTLFSFGTIKTKTALGGACVAVKDGDLRRRMAAILASLPLSPTSAFAKKLAVAAVIKALTGRLAFSILFSFGRLLGWDYDRFLNEAVRSFRRGPLLTALRKRLCPAQRSLLARRLGQTCDLRGRARSGDAAR